MYIQILEVMIAGNIEFTSNCYLISQSKTDSCVAIIDPGDEATRILNAIGERRVDAIILTHGHYDHIGAVAELVARTGAEVYAHALDADAIREQYELIKEAYADFHNKLFYASDSRDIAALDNEAPAVTVELNDNAVIDTCGVQLEVLHTPGHSQGSICLYNKETGVLFSGDTLFLGTCGRTDFLGGSPKQMGCSLARLAKLPGETVVYPGHGPSTTIAYERTRGLTEY